VSYCRNFQTQVGLQTSRRRVSRLLYITIVELRTDRQTWMITDTLSANNGRL